MRKRDIKILPVVQQQPSNDFHFRHGFSGFMCYFDKRISRMGIFVEEAPIPGIALQNQSFIGHSRFYIR